MSFWRTFYHIVWATDERRHLITPEVERRLYPYLVRKATQEMETYVYAINGWYDHVHLVVAIPPKFSVADFVKRLKGGSSHDLNHAGDFGGSFAWQRGYGVFTLGERQRSIAEAYVNNQKQHHQQSSTNARLERSDEHDEGPSDLGLSVDFVPPLIRESHVSYETLDELPF
ncbi:MAG: IS200/IS605 family transposase [Anaerolineales bacterium]